MSRIYKHPVANFDSDVDYGNVEELPEEKQRQNIMVAFALCY